MSNKIIQLNEDAIKGELKELVRNSMEETRNNLLDQEAKELTLSSANSLSNVEVKEIRYNVPLGGRNISRL